MTDIAARNNTASLSGEERLRARRRVVLASAVILSLIGSVMGFVTGFIGPGSMPAWLAIALSVASVIIVFSGSWIYFGNTDELELQDNLVSAAGGFAAYVLGYPIWTMLAITGVAPRVDHTLLFLGVMMVAGLVYLMRKISHA